MGEIVLYIPFGRDARLLARNLSHYRELGVDRILLDVHLRTTCDEDLLAAVTRVAQAHGATIANICRGPLRPSVERREQVLPRYCADDDWVVLCDIDEFQEYPCDLPLLTGYCERHGYDYVGGRLLDRVAADGRLPPLNDRSLWHEFPAGTQLTVNKRGGDPHKIVLARPWVKIVDGQHHALTGRGLPEEIFCCTVHHFKWDAELVARTRYMRRCHINAGEHWWSESDRLLEFLAASDGRIDLADPGLQTCWPGYKRTEPADMLPGPLHFQRYDRLPWALQPRDTRPVRRPRCALRRLGEGHVLIRVGDDTALRVNGAILAVWELCDGAHSVAEIIDTLAGAFPEHAADMTRDVTDALDLLGGERGFIAATPPRAG
jgi:hypothetical protein